MARSGLNKTAQELYHSWQICKKVCCGNGVRYEGVPIQKEWETFDGFYKDNYQRYCKAKRKWRNYTRLTKRTKNEVVSELKHRTVRMRRRVKANGYTKKNTFFSSPSDVMKYNINTHKYMFENKLLGTRDIQNILKKRGVIINMEAITQRLRLGQGLFEPSIRYPEFWNGCYRSYAEIADFEGVSYCLLKKRMLKNGATFSQSLEYCKKYKEKMRNITK